MLSHKTNKTKALVRQIVFETNSIDAFIPEIWANESLILLERNLVAAQLVHRDFEDEVANFGDTVNTRQPGEFEAKRKGASENVTIQNATATNVPVKLDQHFHTSFLIRDGQESKSFANLRDEYLVPAIQSISQAIDEVLLAQVYQFKDNNAGKLGTSITKKTVLDTRKVLNDNEVPMPGRNLIITPGMESSLLNIGDFTTADKVGDEGTALREGELGRKFGFNIFMDQNAPQITVDPEDTGKINNSGGYSKGTTTITTDGFTITPVAGQWLVVAGDGVPQLITGVSGNDLTIDPGLKRAVSNDANVDVYESGQINNSGGYSAGEIGTLTVDGFSSTTPQRGQMVSFATSANPEVYGLIGSPSQTAWDLDRPLVNAVSDDQVAGSGPAGDYAFAFHRNALALVVRPLAQPDNNLALSSVVNDRGLSIRVTITYNGEKQGHLVTVDLLSGVKVLNSSLGAVMFG